MSFGTFDSELRYNHDGTPIVNQPPLVEAENQIYLGLFDKTYETLCALPDEPTAHRTLDELFVALRERKLNSSRDWSAFVALCRRHPLMALLHQDPFTVRAYSKPRGYAGDAVMMDYIYGREEQWAPPPADPVGRQIFNFTTQAPASEGVRARRAFIATKIDRLAEERRYPHILSIASGTCARSACPRPSGAGRPADLWRSMPMPSAWPKSGDLTACTE